MKSHRGANFKLPLGSLSIETIIHLVLAILPHLVPVPPALGSVPDQTMARPDPEGTPTEVLVALYVIDIENIDNVRQNFTCDFVLTLVWKDARLVGSSRRLSLHEVWHPQANVYNQRGTSQSLPETVEIMPEGVVLYTQRYYGNLAALLDLSDFPLDRQRLPVTIVSFLYGPEEVRFVLDEENTGRNEDFSSAAWSIGQGQGGGGVFQAASSHRRDRVVRLAQFDYAFQASRHLKYYLWKVIWPLCLIVMMSWAVFWVDPSKIEAQISVSATTMLTIIAFIFSLKDILPPISYLTRLDYFVYASLCFVFLAFVEALTTCYAALRGHDQFSTRLDLWSRWIFPIGFILVLFWLWI